MKFEKKVKYRVSHNLLLGGPRNSCRSEKDVLYAVRKLLKNGIYSYQNQWSVSFSLACFTALNEVDFTKKNFPRKMAKEEMHNAVFPLLPRLNREGQHRAGGTQSPKPKP